MGNYQISIDDMGGGNVYMTGPVSDIKEIEH